MKRIAFAAATVVLLGTGCISHTTTNNPPPPPPPPNAGAVDFAWSFVRYDATGAPIATYGCAQAGIDNVVVSFQAGGDVMVSCSDAAGDGALISDIAAGTQTVVVTGRRGTVDLFQSHPLTLTVAVGQTTAAHGVQALGIPDNLAVYANFRSRFGADVGWSTCALAGVASLDYSIADFANTVVATGSVSCTDPAGISFFGANALDRDNYVIRMRAPAGTNPPTFDSASVAVTPACSGQAFDHFGQVATDVWDVFLFDVTQNATLCP